MAPLYYCDTYAGLFVVYREEVLAQVYCTMGNASMELGKLDDALNYFTKDMEIGEEQ